MKFSFHKLQTQELRWVSQRWVLFYCQWDVLNPDEYDWHSFFVGCSSVQQLGVSPVEAQDSALFLPVGPQVEHYNEFHLFHSPQANKNWVVCEFFFPPTYKIHKTSLYFFGALVRVPIKQVIRNKSLPYLRVQNIDGKSATSFSQQHRQAVVARCLNAKI